MGRLKVGVFGAYRGMTMIRVLAEQPDAALVAVCDKYRPALDKVKELADEKGIRLALCESFDEFISEDMDAVVLANYANEHAPFAVRLLNSGRHVLSEVLPSENIAQAMELIEAAEASGKVYAYAENYCYMRGPFEMRRRYEAGEIGEIQYAEGEYVHDCASIWPQITYGERNHWRNRMHPMFYCTHSLGPLLFVSGRRPVRVSGFITNANRERGISTSPFMSAGAVEMVTLDNSAVVKSLHGGLKREPGSVNYEIYGTKGMMETNRWDGANLSVYKEGEKLCRGELTHYNPEPFIRPDLAGAYEGHGGSDFYATHFFIERMLGNPDGLKYGIDVYAAVDMGICGILAYRSALSGGAPVDVPNLRDPAERDAFRGDRACTNPEAAGDQLLPLSPEGTPVIPDEEYERIRRLWLEGKECTE